MPQNIMSILDQNDFTFIILLFIHFLPLNFLLYPLFLPSIRFLLLIPYYYTFLQYLSFLNIYFIYLILQNHMFHCSNIQLKYHLFLLKSFKFNLLILYLQIPLVFYKSLSFYLFQLFFQVIIIFLFLYVQINTIH